MVVNIGLLISKSCRSRHLQVNVLSSPALSLLLDLIPNTSDFQEMMMEGSAGKYLAKTSGDLKRLRRDLIIAYKFKRAGTDHLKPHAFGYENIFGQTRIDGMDDKIIGLYAAGLSTRDIRAHLEEVYGLQVSAELISRVTDAVLEEVSDWQNRALEPIYPIVFLDALRVKIRDAESRQVKNKAVYVALGVTPEGEREVLGLWIANTEGAKFWLSVMNNLRNRGVEDILIAVVDGLKGFPDAINAVFPETTVQTCIVHLVRHSLNFCGWKDRKNVAKDLKRIYQATDDVEAEKALADFEAEWGRKYPSIALSWRRAWQEVIPFFAFPPAVRKIIYTTNAIESLNRVIRKTTKTRGSFPTDDAATKLIYLAIRNFEKAGRCVREWPLSDASIACR